MHHRRVLGKAVLGNGAREGRFALAVVVGNEAADGWETIV